MATTINGATRVYAIIGDPISHVRSPQIYTDVFTAAGINAVLIPAQIAQGELDVVLPALMELKNLDGLLVTSPFKAQVGRFAATILPNAKRVGAVNALRREADGSWTADMFDGIGFLRGLQAKGHTVAGKRVLLFGLGGAGLAIAVALADAGAASMTVMSLDAGKAKQMIAKLEMGCPGCVFQFAANLDEAQVDAKDLVINASTVGMKEGDGMPADIGLLRSNVVVGDVVLHEATVMVKHAIQCGCAFVNGYDMHTGQIAAITEFFLGASASEVSL